MNDPELRYHCETCQARPGQPCVWRRLHKAGYHAKRKREVTRRTGRRTFGITPRPKPIRVYARRNVAMDRLGPDIPTPEQIRILAGEIRASRPPQALGRARHDGADDDVEERRFRVLME